MKPLYTTPNFRGGCCNDSNEAGNGIDKGDCERKWAKASRRVGPSSNDANIAVSAAPCENPMTPSKGPSLARISATAAKPSSNPRYSGGSAVFDRRHHP